MQGSVNGSDKYNSKQVEMCVNTNKIYTVNNIKMLYTNVRSLTSGTKGEELQVLIKTENVDVVGITETWGKADILDSEMKIPGFKLYRKDRATVNDKKGGGVALYVKNSLRVDECDSLNSKLCESVWCKIYAERVGHFVVGVCYRSQEADEIEMGEMFECIKLACEANRSVLIMGDFNYPDINWNMLKTDNNSYNFLKLVMDCNLEQHVSLPTRGNNILDIILTSDLPIKDGVRILAPVANSDHNVLIFSIDCNKGQDKEKIQLAYNQADYSAMREFVKLRLSDLEVIDMSASTVWSHLNEVMQEAIKRLCYADQLRVNRENHYG